MILELGNPLLQVAQVSVEPGIAIIEEEFLFSIPQFLLALFSGLVMAFAFQFLLTNLAVAFVATPGTPKDTGESESLGHAVRGIETKLGLFVLVSVSIALFAANFLAVKLSLVNSTTLGAIVGVVVWSTYFTLLVWLGSNALGSLLGSFISAATSGVQGIMGAASTAIGANVAKNQAVSTAEEIAAVVRQELTSGINPAAIQQTLTRSLASLPISQLNFDEIGEQFEKILKNADLSDLSDSDLLKNLNRDTIVNLIRERTDLSKEDVDRIADRLQSAFKSVQKSSSKVSDRLLDLVSTATPEELQSSELYPQIEQLIRENSGKKQPSLGERAVELGMGSLLAVVQNRVDLSDLDVENISGQLQRILGKVADSTASESTNVLPARRNTIKADVEGFVLGALPWYFNRFSLPQEFHEFIYDPQANPAEIRWQLEELNLSNFTNLLTQRGDLSPALVQESAEIMETVRQEVLETARKAEAAERLETLQEQLGSYLRSTEKSKLNENNIQQEIQQLLNNPDVDLDTLQNYFSNLDQDRFRSLLQGREDLSEEEVTQLANQIASLREQALQSIQSLRDQAQQRVNELRQRVEDYLRNTNRDELNPDEIEREIRLLFDDPQVGLSALRLRLSQFDRNTLVGLLSQREDLSEEQVNQILDQIESIRDSILRTPRQLADRAKQQYEETTQALAQYLRNTNLEELDPEGIQRDLTTLLSDPQQGTAALRERLSHIDRETLVKLLSQRGDLTEEQVNQAIDQVQSAIRNLINAPRRYVSRVQQRAVNFEQTLENYLRNTNKEELNPEGIKRDLQQLLNDPRAGLGDLSDRLSKVDRATLVALLAQRKDITEDEANQIIDQVLSVRDRMVEQVQQLQQRFQSLIDGVFDQVRTYLNSLNRPELNYEGIQRDFITLFDDPASGIEALQTRLSQFDRGTLIAVLSSNSNISQADANRIVDQIEAARDNVLGRAESIQQETQRRLKQIQHQAHQQAIETQKMAAGAAWWLFGAALSSLASSAIAGFLAVR